MSVVYLMSVRLIGSRCRAVAVSVVDFFLRRRHEVVGKVVGQVEAVQLDVDQVHGQGKLVSIQLSVLDDGIYVKWWTMRQNMWISWKRLWLAWSTSASLQILASTGLGRRDLTISFFAVLPVIFPLCGPRD